MSITGNSVIQEKYKSEDLDAEHNPQNPIRSGSIDSYTTEEKKLKEKSSSRAKKHKKKSSHRIYNPFFGCYMQPVPHQVPTIRKSINPTNSSSLTQNGTQKDIITSIDEIFDCPMDLKVTIHIPPMYTTRKRWSLTQELELIRLWNQHHTDWNVISKSCNLCCTSCLEMTSSFSPSECSSYFNSYLRQSTDLGYWSKREILKLLEMTQSNEPKSNYTKEIKNHDHFQISSMMDLLKTLDK